MYFSRFRKYSSGRSQYGRGFVLHFKLFSRHVSLIFGIKKTRTILGFNNIKLDNHQGRYKMHTYYLYAFFWIIVFSIRTTHKTDENLFQSIIQRKKNLIQRKKKLHHQ